MLNSNCLRFSSNSTDLNWRIKNDIEPFEMVKRPPTQNFPTTFLVPNAIENSKLDKIKKVQKPNGSSPDFWRIIEAGGVGTADVHLLKPDFASLVGMNFIHLWFIV